MVKKIDVVPRSKLLFVSDTLSILNNYRRSLMKASNDDFLVDKAGWFDQRLLVTIFKILFCDVIVSSNLRSNILCLLFFWKKSVIILNGFGRYESSKLVRFLIVSLSSSFSKRKIVVAQSYRDYRYIRRYNTNVRWVPGSGGENYAIGETDCLLVTRDTKLECVAKSVISFYKSRSVKLIVAGCELGLNALDGVDYLDVGYVSEKQELFSLAGSFLQPEGYGEGIAHSLVDAVCSGMKVYLPKSVFVKTGFYYLLSQSEKMAFIDGWCCLTASSLDILKNHLSLCSVNEKYLDAIRSVYK